MTLPINRRDLFAALAAATLLPTGLAQAQDQAADQSAEAVQTEDVKSVLVYGDSNTWGYIPVEASPTERYAADIRWPGVMAAELGEGYEILEEGLSARTTDVPDPDLPQIAGAGLDGSATLSPTIASHLPLDLVVIMLGTNDVKAKFDRSPFRVALGMGKLIDIVRQTGSGVGTDYTTPEVLVLAPPPLGEIGPEERAQAWEGGAEKTKELAKHYQAVAEAAGAHFLDVGTLTGTDGVDGVHFSAEAHGEIGRGVAEEVRSILE